MEKKREGDREAAGGFLASDPLYHCFFYWGWERGAAKVALTALKNKTLTRHDRNKGDSTSD
jgi:hypothetical protein